MKKTGGTLLVLFGDQLDSHSSLLEELEPSHDTVLMMEVKEESTSPLSHRHRTILFLSAMRHFARDLEDRGLSVRYVALDDPMNTHSFETEIDRAIVDLRPGRLRFIRPGNWRVHDLVQRLLGVHDGEMLEDAHFLLQPNEFALWAQDRKSLVMEHFYRMMRKRLGLLMKDDGTPMDGQWNFDAANRKVYRVDREGDLPDVQSFPPDAITREVMKLVDRVLPDLPGASTDFDWPVTRADALEALDDFVTLRLPRFGTYQDAMVRGEPWMFHSLISSSINLKLLDPREVVDRAVDAWRSGHAPINSIEGFVRQIIGWREFIRGVYWWSGRGYEERNELGDRGRLPAFYWDAKTEMTCLEDAIGQVLEHGFGHHIQRLMLTGNFALLAGVEPRAVSAWYLGMYVDAIEWVTIPNTLGMAMHADGGIVGTKPYVSSGRYIDRMSNYCGECVFDPTKRVGSNACPFSTFYWDFLHRHRRRFRNNRRMSLVLKSLAGIPEKELKQISARARDLRQRFGIS